VTFPMGRHLLREISLSFRRLGAAPLITVTLVLTLAAVIGAESLLAVSLDALLLRRLPYRAPEQLVMLWEANPQNGLERLWVSPANFSDWRRHARSLTGISAARTEPALLDDRKGVSQVRVARVTADFFRLFGVAAAVGRDFAGPLQHELILSQELWSRVFGKDPHVVGRSVRLDDRTFTVAGIAPPSFNLPYGTDVWAVAPLEREGTERGLRSLIVFARLRPRIATASAEAEMKAIAAQLARDYPATNKGFTAELAPLSEVLRQSTRRTLLFLFAAASLALVITCVNLSNLQLVRTSRRKREFGIRSMLGARRADLLYPVLSESLVLAIAGGTTGLLLTHWTASLIGSLAPAALDLGSLGPLHLLAMDLPVSIMAGLAIAMVPTLYVLSQSRQPPLLQANRAARVSLRFTPMQKLLLVLQVGLSLPLLVTCGILVQNFIREQRINLGFNPAGLIAADLTLSRSGSEAADRNSSQLAQLVDRLAQLPWVAGVAAVTDLPLSGASSNTSFWVEGRAPKPEDPPQIADQHSVTAAYFRTMQIPVLRGRGLLSSDRRETPPVVVINATLATRIFPGEDPIGKYLFLGSPEELALYGRQVPWQVVGIVGNVRHESLEGDFRSEIYLPFSQMPSSVVSLVIRVPRTGTARLSDLRGILASLQWQGKLGWIRPMHETIAAAAGRPGVQIFFFTLFTVLSIILVGASSYVVVAYSVDQGAAGIGLALALGARRRHIVLLVLGQVLGLTLLGIGFGIPSGLAAAQLLAHRILMLSRADPLPYIVASALLFSVVLLAGWLPALRVIGAEPRVLLEHKRW
jgi:putative ABC transport system permease protein